MARVTLLKCDARITVVGTRMRHVRPRKNDVGHRRDIGSAWQCKSQSACATADIKDALAVRYGYEVDQQLTQARAPAPHSWFAGCVAASVQGRRHDDDVSGEEG